MGKIWVAIGVAAGLLLGGCASDQTCWTGSPEQGTSCSGAFFLKSKPKAAGVSHGNESGS